VLQVKEHRFEAENLEVVNIVVVIVLGIVGAASSKSLLRLGSFLRSD
jgi:hypothetical protein